MTRVLWALLALVVAGPAAAFDAAAHLQPRSDRYAVEWSGISLGEGTIALAGDGTGCYRYSSTTAPIALVRWTYGAPREESHFCLRDGEVMPERFEYVNDKRGGDSFRLDFDWRNAQVKTLKAGVLTVRRLPGPAYDRFSIREAVRLWVLRNRAGEAPDEAEFVMVDDDRFKAFRFAIVGLERIVTAAGPLDALRVERIDDKRPHHYWLAPERDYLPVRIEQFKGGKRELRMELLP
ncbi:DUF3108 domain-containing protein [Fontimonas sp. SYSU GA230001]|uniref:DUF3108 domain-containing protein n=1 Tax=Fontimonas sp. SYSU GA230001 TaxID=3142450 RepID=UPI0032B37092